MKINRGKLESPYWKMPFTAKEQAIAHWGIGVCTLVQGLSEWATPPKSPFTGRWGWFNAIANDVMGEHGPALFQFGITAILFCVGLAKWVTHRSQKQR